MLVSIITNDKFAFEHGMFHPFRFEYLHSELTASLMYNSLCSDCSVMQQRSRMESLIDSPAVFAVRTVRAKCISLWHTLCSD